jgi:G-protein alpha subunit
MRIIHERGFPDEERRQIRAVIYSNMIVAFRLLLEIMNTEEFGFTDEKTKIYAETVEATDPDVDADEAFSDENVRDAMKAMWLDAGVQQAVAKAHEFTLHDNLSLYVLQVEAHECLLIFRSYFRNLDRMFAPNWMPNDQDMLHARLRTTGITETLFEMRDINFRMMDVGGQRSERKKWIHCFEGVQCLLFMVALSGYDQCLVEDQNAVSESMAVSEILTTLITWIRTKCTNP